MERGERPLYKRLKKALDEKKFADIKFIVGEEQYAEVILAHRQIISTASPVFEAMCFGVLAAGDDPVRVPDITPVAFKEMLQYIYTDNLNVTSVETACSLLYAAEKYMITDLTSKCLGFVLPKICPDTAWHIFERCFFNKTVIRRCLQTCDIVSHPNFVDVSKDTLVAVLDQEYLKISSEEVLLDACVRWANNQCEALGMEPTQVNLSGVLGPAVSKIRFLSMPAYKLLKSRSFNKLVAPADAYTILANIILPGSVQLSPNFSKVNITRYSAAGLALYRSRRFKV